VNLLKAGADFSTRFPLITVDFEQGERRAVRLMNFSKVCNSEHIFICLEW
jgi:hypothetical protein